MKRKTKIILFGIILVIVSMVSLLVLLINKLDSDVEVILNEVIIEVDLSTIEDGVYNGEYTKALAVSSEVEVTIQNNRITNIEIIKHINGQGGPAEVIINDIMEYQSLLVDDIAGATYSSRVLKLSIQDALKE